MKALILFTAGGGGGEETRNHHRRCVERVVHRYCPTVWHCYELYFMDPSGNR